MIGANLAGPAAGAAAEYFQAQRTAHPIYVDGKEVQLEAYAIGGNNYVKLRDVGKAVGFEVYWDGSAAQVFSDKPYTGEAPSPEDYSQAANPAIFQGVFNRGVYNTVREVLLTGQITSFGSSFKGLLEVRYDTDPETRKKAEREVLQIETLLSTFGQYPIYERISSGGEYLCQVRHPDSMVPPAQHTQGFIDSLVGLSDREKAEEIAWYVADRITYKVAYPGPGQVLSQDGQVPGCCMAYAHSFMFLCDRAGIPCIFVHSDDHQWNKVYVEGRWWDVDVTADDCGDETHLREYITVLQPPSEMQGYSYIDIDPEITAFAQELLVPGSTK